MFAEEQQTDDYLRLRLLLTAALIVIVLLCPSLCRRISEIAEQELALEEEYSSYYRYQQQLMPRDATTSP